MRQTLSGLRRRLAALAPDKPPPAGLFALGCAGLDGHLGGGLARGAVHEVYARAPHDGVAAAGFALALALCAGGARPLVWARHGLARLEAGGLYAPGLVEFGADPERVVMVEAREPLGVLRAGAEGLRSSAPGVVVIELWGTARALDLTASRRLMMAAARSGVTALVVRVGAEPRPSAALSRWRVGAGASVPLAAGAPGRPVFELALERHRAGIPGRSWRVEWDRDGYCFRPPALPRRVAALPADRPAAPRAGRERIERAG